MYPDDLPAERRNRETAIDLRKLSIPIHHLESICLFGLSTVSAPALGLCWDNGVAVNFLTEHGFFLARMTGVADTSVTLRRVQFRAADCADKCAAIARQIVAGKIQNSRNSLLRAARENDNSAEQAELEKVIGALARQIQHLACSSSDGAIGSRRDPRRGRACRPALFLRLQPHAQATATNLSLHNPQPPSAARTVSIACCPSSIPCCGTTVWPP